MIIPVFVNDRRVAVAPGTTAAGETAALVSTGLDLRFIVVTDSLQNQQF